MRRPWPARRVGQWASWSPCPALAAEAPDSCTRLIGLHAAQPNDGGPVSLAKPGPAGLGASSRHGATAARGMVRNGRPGAEGVCSLAGLGAVRLADRERDGRQQDVGDDGSCTIMQFILTCSAVLGTTVLGRSCCRGHFPTGLPYIHTQG